MLDTIALNAGARKVSSQDAHPEMTLDRDGNWLSTSRWRAIDGQVCNQEACEEGMQLPPRYVQLTARKGAHVRAHNLPLPQPETVVLANQDNFSMIGHGVFSI